MIEIVNILEYENAVFGKVGMVVVIFGRINVKFFIEIFLKDLCFRKVRCLVNLMGFRWLNSR